MEGIQLNIDGMHSTVGSHRLGQIKSKAENILFSYKLQWVHHHSVGDEPTKTVSFRSILSLIDRFSINSIDRYFLLVEVNHSTNNGHNRRYKNGKLVGGYLKNNMRAAVPTTHNMFELVMFSN